MTVVINGPQQTKLIYQTYNTKFKKPNLISNKDDNEKFVVDSKFDNDVNNKILSVDVKVTNLK